MSCTNQDEIIDNVETNLIISPENSLNDVLVISSLEEWNKLFHSELELINLYTNPPLTQQQLGMLFEWSFKGYSTLETRQGNLKVQFPPAFADKAGVQPYSTYITDYLTAKAVINFPTRVFPVILPSPDCGLQPDNMELRGYTMSQNGQTVTFSTYLIHIKYDITGRLIDIWYPIYPDNLQWIYGRYDPDADPNDYI